MYADCGRGRLDLSAGGPYRPECAVFGQGPAYQERVLRYDADHVLAKVAQNEMVNVHTLTFPAPRTGS